MTKLKRDKRKSYIGYGLVGAYGADIEEVIFIAPNRRILESIHNQHCLGRKYDPKKSCLVKVIKYQPRKRNGND